MWSRCEVWGIFCSLDCAIVSILSASIHFEIYLSLWSCPILQAINIKNSVLLSRCEVCGIFCSLDCAVVSILSESSHFEICLSLWSRLILQAINIKELCAVVSL